MRIQEITEDYILFDNGNVITYDHDQGCCEDNNMDIGTSIINMSLNEYAKRIRQTVNDITDLIKELYFHKNFDNGRYKEIVLMKISHKQKMLSYLEDAYVEIYK